MKIVKTPRPPRGLRRLLFRLPITLYRMGLGGLLARRFVLINHIGRTSGVTRQVVVEMVDRDPRRGTFTVPSGFGGRSDWYRNLMRKPEVTIQVGRRTLPVAAVPLPPDEAEETMVAYARRHPFAARRLAPFMGFEVDGSEADYRQVAREIPFVRFTPRAAR